MYFFNISPLNNKILFINNLKLIICLTGEYKNLTLIWRFKKIKLESFKTVNNFIEICLLVIEI